MDNTIFKHMELKCKCGSTCISTAEEILIKAKNTFNPCKNCLKPSIKKFTPISKQISLNSFDSQFERCLCGKRHLDLVMAHVLKLMIRENLQSKNATLRNACAPLITPAYPLQASPYLGENSLIVLSPKMNQKCAEKIMEEVPEVKAVIKGESQNVVGLKDSSYNPHVYETLAGCDMRCDIMNTPKGPICVHKDQSEIHIEFPSHKSAKITSTSLFIKKNFHNMDFTVIDATSGPGTLGIFSLMAGASKVIFNDLWKPATHMTALNLEVNGFKVDFFNEKLEKCMIACGKQFKVYNLDIRNLNSVLDEKFDLCIIDPFPGVNPKEFEDAAKKLSKKVLLI
ncbi:MAG: methyltransferase [Methanobacteriaceae archaeon]|nr:methyltransferase [Methanobacteriaceae archaeon]